MATHPRRIRGFLLVTTLVLSTVLFVQGLAYLNFTCTDYQFSGRMANEERAFYLAWSGMQYYAVQGIPAPDSSGVCSLAVDDGQHQCRFQKQGSDLVFVGVVENDRGKIIAERDLIAPGGNLQQWYERTR